MVRTFQPQARDLPQASIPDFSTQVKRSVQYCSVRIKHILIRIRYPKSFDHLPFHSLSKSIYSKLPNKPGVQILKHVGGNKYEN